MYDNGKKLESLVNMATTVTEINIFPVKSLSGISVAASHCTARGLQYDRRFMVIDDHHQFLTQRDHSLMATIKTAIDGEQLILSSPFDDCVSVPLAPRPLPTRTVTVWSSPVHAHTVSADADQWLSDYLGIGARLVYMPDTAERHVSPDYAKNGEIVSFADGYPLLIASEESLADLNAKIVAGGGAAVPMNRFRANVVVRGCDAFAEETWGNFQIGGINGPTLRGAKPCTRCQVTTTDQTTGEMRGPEPLRTLATYRDSPSGVRFGMNFLPVTLGMVRTGDALTFTN